MWPRRNLGLQRIENTLSLGVLEGSAGLLGGGYIKLRRTFDVPRIGSTPSVGAREGSAGRIGPPVVRR